MTQLSRLSKFLLFILLQVLFFSLITSSTASAAAQPSIKVNTANINNLLSAAPPSLEFKAGFDSYYKEYRWLPVEVTLSLPAGEAPFQGRVEASLSNFGDETAIYRREVQLVPPARKTIWLYLNSSRGLQQVQVRVVTDDGTVVVAPQSKDISPLGDKNLLLGVISDDSSALNYLNGLTVGQATPAYSPFLFSSGYGYSSSTSVTPQANQPKTGNSLRITVAHLSYADLPSGIGSALSAIDVLVLADLNSSNFSGDGESLRATLSGWISQGGTLFAAGNSVLRRAPFVRSFLPVNSDAFQSTHTISTEKLSSLQTFSGATAPLPSANIELADVLLGTNAPGNQSLLSLDSKPLLTRRTVGLGETWFFAVELRPLRNWDGINSFWTTIFKDFRIRENYITNARRSNQSSAQEFSSRLTPSPQTNEPPGAGTIALFLFFYVLIIGPLNYLVLRRFKRRELAWFSVPVLTILFTISVYAYSNFSTVNDLVMSRMAIITLGQSGDGKLSGATNGIVSFYSSSRSNFELKAAEDALAASLFNTGYNRFGASSNFNNSSVTGIVNQGPGGNLGLINLGIRGQRSFGFEKDESENSGIQARLKIINGSLEGSLENASKQGWQDISLIVPDGTSISVQKIGSLNPAEKRQIGPGGLARSQPNLVQFVTGANNYTKFFPNSKVSSGSYHFSSPGLANSLPNQKAMVLETLFGTNGEGLSTDAGHFYLVAWRSEASIPLSVETNKIQFRDLTLLFEPLSAEQ